MTFVTRHRIYRSRGGDWNVMVDGRQAPFFVRRNENDKFDVWADEEDMEGEPVCLGKNLHVKTAELRMDAYKFRD